MPITSVECPGCGQFVHTDCLIEGECTLNDCGYEFRESFYKKNQISDFYNPYK